MRTTPVELAERLARLGAKPPRRGRRSAVAAVLRWRTGGAIEVLLMQRAERDGDRWSGHVSLPGGGHQDNDADLIATAVRETREEVGVDLAGGARLLGQLPHIKAIAKGKLLPMSVTPFVFEARDVGPITLGAEATAAFWLPLTDAAAGAFDDRYEYRLGPVPLSLPCWRFEQRIVWGLTYQILSRLIEILRG